MRIFILILLTFTKSIAQVGDGFGGRLWYKPSNYSVGSYSGYSICYESNTLYSWGSNLYGQLGDSSMINKLWPIKISLDNVKYFNSGYICGAIKYDNTLWSWGRFSNYPVLIDSNVYSVSGGNQTLAMVKTDGSVYSIGWNYVGSFGNNTTSSSFTSKPVKMLNIDNAVRVSCGIRTTLILLKDGRVFSTGYNFTGGLGVGSHINMSLIPIEIKGLKNIVDIKSTATAHIALDSDGNLYEWGKLSQSTKYTPEKVNIKNVIAISGKNDGYHFLILDENGNCYGIGSNNNSELGNDTIQQTSEPIKITDNTIDIMAGEHFSYILKKDGLYATGRGDIWMNLGTKKINKLTKIDPLMVGTCNPYRSIITQSYTICSKDTPLTNYTYYTYIKDTFYTYIKDTLIITNLKVYPRFNIIKDHWTCNYIYINGIKRYKGTYIDTLKSIYGCDSIITNNVYEYPSYSYKKVLTICNNESYIWNNKIINKEGTYIDTLKSIYGCDSITELKLYYHPLNKLEKYDKICSWDSINNRKVGTYIDTILDHNRCKSFVIHHIDSIPIELCYRTNPYAPNAFNPNSINDKFRIIGIDIEKVNLIIYNRWGEKVFEANDKDPSWDGKYMGKECQTGVYLFIANIKGYGNEVFNIKGTFTLLR